MIKKLYCDECGDEIELCDECGEAFKVEDEIICHSFDHIHKSCLDSWEATAVYEEYK